MSNNAPEDSNLLNFIATTVETMRDQMTTMHDQMATMRDQMATKSDVTRLEDKMEAEFAVVRGDIEQVQLRLDSIERALRARLGQIEAEVSRLRSVIYLLVKDQPDMLRLLGQPPSLSDEGRT
jgi:hypothetical protein